MAFQGKEFTPEMKQLVVNLKQHFDDKKKRVNLFQLKIQPRELQKGWESVRQQLKG